METPSFERSEEGRGDGTLAEAMIGAIHGLAIPCAVLLALKALRCFLV
jgi:hypothetical protein